MKGYIKMNTAKCQVCGKEFKKDNSHFVSVMEKNSEHRDFYELCPECTHDYYNAKYAKDCSRCGKNTKAYDLFELNGKPVCYNCAFKNGKEEYVAFKHAVQEYNENNLLDYKKQKKKTSLILFLKVAIVFVLIDIFLFIITYSFSTNQAGLILSAPLFIIVFLYIKSKKVKDFVPLTEEEYYNDIYLRGNKFNANSTPISGESAANINGSNKKNVAELYRLLETGMSNMTSSEIATLIDDFKGKSSTIDLESGFKYAVECNAGTEPAILLMINETSHITYYFDVFHRKIEQEQTIKVFPGSTTYHINCSFRRL